METDNSKKQINGAIIIVLFFGIIYLIAKNNMELVEKSINDNKIESVCQVYKFYSNRTFRTYYYRFFFDGKEYFDSKNIDVGEREKTIGKYYKVIFSSKNVNFSKIFLEDEIKDTIQIKKAGF
jgi:hypothetical protein